MPLQLDEADLERCRLPTPDVTQADREALHIATDFHETYERLAPSFGYETRADTKAVDADSPNGRLMMAVCSEVVARHRTPDTARIAALGEALRRIAKLEGIGGPDAELQCAEIATTALGNQP